MKKLEKIKQERIIKKQTKEYIESLNPMSKKQKFMEFMNTIYKHKFFYLILIPAIVLLIIFAYRPMYGIVIAFKNFSPRKGIMGSPWVGLENFERIFDLDMFWQAFKNTIVINLLKLIFGFPLSILLAIMINAVKNKIFKNTVQTFVYLPHFVSWVVVAGIIFALFDERSGSLYKLLSGVVDLNIFGDGKQFVTMLVVSDIWKEVGWGAIIYLAALSGVSEDLYEASELDGANKIQQLFNVTIPQILPTISIMLILRVGGLIGGGFDQIYNLYNSTVYEYADVLDTFIYRYGIGDGEFEVGTAVGLFSNVINIALLLGANKIVEIINKAGE
jgi:putative aldouronate transport system permease protein